MAKVKGRIEPLTFNYYLLAMRKGTHPCPPVEPCSVRTWPLTLEG
jgi:hypothetical protein